MFFWLKVVEGLEKYWVVKLFGGILSFVLLRRVLGF